MSITLGELKNLGFQAFSNEQLDAALKIYWRLVDIAPGEVIPRLRLADTVARAGAAQEAARLYVAAATHAMRAGHPLLAILVGKILESVQVDPSELYDQLALLYSSESDRVSRYGERLAPLADDTQIKPPDMAAEIPLASLIAGAVAAGTDLERVGEYPRMLHRLPLLSDLSGPTFRRVLDAMVAHRLPDGAMVIREGEIGSSFFLVTGGSVRVYRNDIQGRTLDLATLHEGALFGEMALIQASPRMASVTVMGEADLLEVTKEGLSSLASEMDNVAMALDRSHPRSGVLCELSGTADAGGWR